MKAEELKTILEQHKLWLESNHKKGKRADLCGADLRGAYLRGADLHDADLAGANLHGADLRGADLRGADLSYADLSGADLHRADLTGANLHGANLLGANFRDTDLNDANIDYSCWPLWCGSLHVKIDARIAAQLMYHAMRAMQSVEGDAEVAAVLSCEENIRLANRFHRVKFCGELDTPKAMKGGAK